MATSTFGGMSLTVVDTPGLVWDYDGDRSTLTEIYNYLYSNLNSIDMFIIVMKRDTMFLPVQSTLFYMIHETFGQEIWKSTVIVGTHFSYKDLFKGKVIDGINHLTPEELLSTKLSTYFIKNMLPNNVPLKTILIDPHPSIKKMSKNGKIIYVHHVSSVNDLMLSIQFPEHVYLFSLNLFNFKFIASFALASMTLLCIALITFNCFNNNLCKGQTNIEKKTRKDNQENQEYVIAADIDTLNDSKQFNYEHTSVTSIVINNFVCKDIDSSSDVNGSLWSNEPS